MGTRSDGVYTMIHGEDNDIWMGFAMQTLGIRVGDSRDENGLQTFYIAYPEYYILGKSIECIEINDKYPQKLVINFRVLQLFYAAFKRFYSEFC